MVSRAERYDLLAGLLDYPEDGGYEGRFLHCAAALRGEYADEAELLRPLCDLLAGMTLEQAQELYTRTFDINPVCTLEVGWHIYGEDYARGAFLVKMRQELRDKNLPESRELPDHLTHVLALLGRLAGEEADELVARYLVPAADKMLAGMSKNGSPYEAVLETVVKVARKDHDVEAVAPRERRGDPPGFKSQLPVFGTRGCSGVEGRKS
jgi:nitrate reductase molybdenum cofactor assembly chaperone